MWGNKRRKRLRTLEALSEFSKTPSGTGAMIRGFFIDARLPNYEALSVAAGCSPISKEGSEMEEQDSLKRLAKIAHLSPLVYSYAEAIAAAAISTMFAEADTTIPKEALLMMQGTIRNIALSTLLGSLSQLVDMGFVEVPYE